MKRILRAATALSVACSLGFAPALLASEPGQEGGDGHSMEEKVGQKVRWAIESGMFTPAEIVIFTTAAAAGAKLPAEAVLRDEDRMNLGKIPLFNQLFRPAFTRDLFTEENRIGTAYRIGERVIVDLRAPGATGPVDRSEAARTALDAWSRSQTLTRRPLDLDRVTREFALATLIFLVSQRSRMVSYEIKPEYFGLGPTPDGAGVETVDMLSLAVDGGWRIEKVADVHEVDGKVIIAADLDTLFGY